MDEETQQSVRAHLATGCVACQRQIAWLERALPALRALDGPPVPEQALARATARFYERFVQPSRPSFLARLRFDSRTQHTPAFARGGQEIAWQRVYSTDAHDIELWQEQDTSGVWYLIGQVLPHHDGEAIVLQSVVLTSAEGNTRTIHPDMGEFHVPSVPAGIYQILLNLPEGDIHLPDVTIGM